MQYLNYTVTGRARRSNRARVVKAAFTFAVTAAMVAAFTVWAVNLAVV